MRSSPPTGTNCTGFRASEVVRLSGLTIHPFSAAKPLREAGVLPFDPAYLSATVDWRLPNRDLAAVWERRREDVVKARRRLGSGGRCGTLRPANRRRPDLPCGAGEGEPEGEQVAGVVRGAGEVLDRLDRTLRYVSTEVVCSPAQSPAFVLPIR